MRIRSVLVFLACVLLAAQGGCKVVAGAEPEPVVLRSTDLQESSGVCLGADGRIIWTHNDSGDRPRIFGFDSQGRLVAVVPIAVPSAVDWEDMCSFQLGERSCLAIADVGDNQARRQAVEIIVIEEPAASEVRSTDRSIAVPVIERYQFTFPDGPCDCEALAYDPTTDAFLLATKETWRCRLFAIDRKNVGVNRTQTARLIGAIHLPLVTGADISRDGKQLVLCTYGPACLLTRSADGQWLPDPDFPGGMVELPTRKQGEAICFDLAGDRLLVTTEGLPAKLWHCEVKPGKEPTGVAAERGSE